jgi:lipoate-protein ligase A
VEGGGVTFSSATGTAQDSGLAVRLVPYAAAAGPENMAADEVLLQTAAAGTAALRFYGWSEPTASLGYFQAELVRLEDARVAALPFVRRPSGGATLIHHHEVTYGLALPAGAPWQTGEPWLRRMHRIVAAALAELGVTVRMHDGPTVCHSCRFLCFRQFTAGDLLFGSAKVVGSAQRKQRGGLLQHGAVLLAASPHAPVLPGIRELTGVALTPERTIAAITSAFVRDTQANLAEHAWTPAEKHAIAEAVASRYGWDAWNRKR